LINPLDGQASSADSNVATFQAIWPLTLEYTTPGYVLPDNRSQVAITVINWLNDSAVDGTLTVSVTDLESSTLHSETKPFNIAPNETGVVNFTLPGLSQGDYIIHGEVSTTEASAEAFADRLQVGLPGPWLDYQVSPLGVVHPDDVLTYSVSFSNNVGAPLSNAVLTASLPMSVTVVAGSVTDGGTVESGQVRWTLGTISQDQSVLRSFVVQVNTDAAPTGDEPGRLLSEPRLTADEITPTWGPLAWNLVVERQSPGDNKVFLPILLKDR
jgi:uncharacterized repeat protein (TIGR01451 family)